MPPNTTSTSGLPADPAWNPIRRNISLISAAPPSPMRLRSKSTISATMSTAGGALADARTSTSMCRAWSSLGLKMFGTPGSPHGLISGRHCSRAVTCPPAAPSSICASPAASLARSVSVVSACTGFASVGAHGGRKSGHTRCASSSGGSLPSERGGRAVDASGSAGQPGHGGDQARRGASRGRRRGRRARPWRAGRRPWRRRGPPRRPPARAAPARRRSLHAAAAPR